MQEQAFSVAAAATGSRRAPTVAGALPQTAALGQGVSLPKDYVPAAESGHALYQVELASFTGPLDLLLFLIKRHQLNVLDIPMAFVCARYLEALDLMQHDSLDVAAEFLLMASELMHIKSRMLLPHEDVAPGDDDDDGQADPRAALVARLLAYQAFKEAADTLHCLPQLHRDTFARMPEVLDASPGKLRPLDPFSLVRALNQVLQRQKPEIRHQVVMEQVPMRLRMHRLIDLLARAEGEPIAFAVALSEVKAPIDLLVSFLAVLEMAKLKLARLLQGADQALWLQARFATAQQAMERLAGADAQGPGYEG